MRFNLSAQRATKRAELFSDLVALLWPGREERVEEGLQSQFRLSVRHETAQRVDPAKTGVLGSELADRQAAPLDVGQSRTTRCQPVQPDG